MADKQIHELPQGTYSSAARIPQQRQVSPGVWADEFITPGDFPQNPGSGAWIASSAPAISLIPGNHLISGSALQTLTMPPSASLGDRIFLIATGTGGYEALGANFQMINGISNSGLRFIYTPFVLQRPAVDLIYVDSNTWLIVNPQSLPANLDLFDASGGGGN